MSSPVLTTSSVVMCPHGGQVTLTTANSVALVQGSPALLVSDIHTVAGCPFTTPVKPQPCLTVRWMAGSTQSKVNQTAVLLQSSVGICYSAEQIPQGAAIVLQVQTEVKSI